MTQQVTYLIGVALNESGKFRPALEQFVKTRKQHFDAPVGLVASLYEADLLRQLGDDDEAVAAYRRTLSMAGPTDSFKNTWTTLRELRKRVHTAYQDYIESEKFQHAFDIAERSYPVFSRVEKMPMTAGAGRVSRPRRNMKRRLNVRWLDHRSDRPHLYLCSSCPRLA